MEIPSENKLAFVGIIAESLALRHMDVFAGYLAVVDGKILQKGPTEEFKQLQENGFFEDFKITYLDHDQFLIPGFVDCHTHAPQFPNMGIGLDKPLLEWLRNYTFPLEKKYEDLNFAIKVYNQVVKRLLTNGTTTACYFGSLHLDSTIELAKCAAKYGQRALVGKVSMNVENEEQYYNETKVELEQVEQFINAINDMGNDLIQPVITPRFAVSCDLDLMRQLTQLSHKYNCRIQSHISENKEEIDHVLRMNPVCSTYSQVYDICGLLTDKTIMAHGVHLTQSELILIRNRDVGLVHCPASNTRLASGLCPVRKFLDSNIKTGLGTDVAGGDNSSIMDAIRRTMDVSMHLDLMSRQHGCNPGCSISWVEAFYLATLGGARVLNLDDKIGNFAIGKDFDALLVDVYVNGGQVDYYELTTQRTSDYGLALVQQFTYLGDDRNILQVYVKGRKVKDIMVE